MTCQTSVLLEIKAESERLGRVNHCYQRIWSSTLAFAVLGRKGGSTWCNEQERATLEQ